MKNIIIVLGLLLLTTPLHAQEKLSFLDRIAKLESQQAANSQKLDTLVADMADVKAKLSNFPKPAAPVAKNDSAPFQIPTGPYLAPNGYHWMNDGFGNNYLMLDSAMKVGATYQTVTKYKTVCGPNGCNVVSYQEMVPTSNVSTQDYYYQVESTGGTIGSGGRRTPIKNLLKKIFSGRLRGGSGGCIAGGCAMNSDYPLRIDVINDTQRDLL